MLFNQKRSNTPNKHSHWDGTGYKQSFEEGPVVFELVS